MEIKRHLSAHFDGKAMEFFASHQLAFAALSILGIRVLVPWNWKNSHCTLRPSSSAESQAWLECETKEGLKAYKRTKRKEDICVRLYF